MKDRTGEPYVDGQGVTARRYTLKVGAFGLIRRRKTVAMSRVQLPRVYELCDLIADRSSPSAYFQDFDRSVASEPEMKRAWLARERELQRLDDAA